MNDKEKLSVHLTKTRYCASYTQGDARKCPYGAKCRFAHSPEELVRAACIYDNECRFMGRSKGGKTCARWHPSRETKEEYEGRISHTGAQTHNSFKKPQKKPILANFQIDFPALPIKPFVAPVSVKRPISIPAKQSISAPENSWWDSPVGKDEKESVKSVESWEDLVEEEGGSKSEGPYIRGSKDVVETIVRMFLEKGITTFTAKIE